MAFRRREVVWALRARQALEDALTYVAQDSPQNASNLAARVIERADSLAEFSERGRIVPELDDPSLRELLVNPYRLLYEVHERQVLHSRLPASAPRRRQLAPPRGKEMMFVQGGGRRPQFNRRPLDGANHRSACMES